jgi:site-specific recombinase XerD
MRLFEVITEVEWRLLADQPSRTSNTGKRNLAILHAMYFAGLGLSEVCDLSPWDLNGDVRVIYRPNRPRRTRDLSAVSAESWFILEEWEEVRPRSPYFFSTLRGNRLKEQYVKGFVRRYADRAGITKPTHALAAPVEPQPLERPYASRLLDRGLSNQGLAKRLTSVRLPQVPLP